MAAHLPKIDTGEHDGTVTEDENATAARDVSLLSDWRNVVPDVLIVTMKALPWMTVMIVHPLLCAVYLANDGHAVSLVVPWMELPENEHISYLNGKLFASRE